MVCLIRHGQSAANAGADSSFPGETPLSERGKRQASYVAGAVDAPLDLVVVSPFLRAQQTARPILARFLASHRETWPIEEFTYLGSLHGSSTNGGDRYPWVRAYWDRADPYYRDTEGSESFADVWARANTFLADLAACDAGRIVAVGHSLFFRVVVFSLMTGVAVPGADTMRQFRRFRSVFTIANCSVLTLNLAGPGARIVGASVDHIPEDERTGTG